MFRLAKPSSTEFQEIRIPKGKHAARPYWFGYRKRERLSLQFVFTDYARYQLEGIDQQDWNKLAGLSFNLFTNHKNSVMVGWRFNSEEDVFELGFYYHLNGRRHIRKYNGKSEVFASVKVSESVRVNFEVDHLSGMVFNSIETSDGIVRDAVAIRTARRSRVINTWFGGNNAAPNDIYILRKLT